MKKHILVGQSGGPTAVINASAQGVIQTGFNHGGRSAVDKGEKVQTKAKSNQ